MLVTFVQADEARRLERKNDQNLSFRLQILLCILVERNVNLSKSGRNCHPGQNWLNKEEILRQLQSLSQAPQHQLSSQLGNLANKFSPLPSLLRYSRYLRSFGVPFLTNPNQPQSQVQSYLLSKVGPESPIERSAPIPFEPKPKRFWNDIAFSF